MPMRLWLISSSASVKSVCGRQVGRSSPWRMMSETWVSSRRPSAPPGCERAKSSLPKPRASSSATASASPRASAAVVLAVGARFSGQASCRAPAYRWMSAYWASGDSASPVRAMRAAPTRLTCGTMVISSSVRPELDSAMNTSCAVTMPRSPWLASAGCTKKAGVPVEASVAAILRAMCPDLPMPLTMTRPWQASTWRQARQKPSSSVSRRCCTASASMASTWRARSSRALSSIWAGGWEVMRGQGNETGDGATDSWLSV